MCRRMNIRKIDQIKIKEFRFKDKMNNPNFTYLSALQLSSLKSEITTETSVYTFDFAGGL